MKFYLVGGAVRDELLGISSRERDWCVVGATPDKLIAKGYKKVGKDFPVFLHPKTKEEYALARKERKSGRGYHGFDFDISADISLEEDLLRRDITINAIAKDCEGKFIDPYGGCKDIKNRVIRHVSDAFTEDPLRILRVAKFAARFSSLNFRISDGTMMLMKSMVKKGEINDLVADRVWKETEEALLGKNCRVFFEVLHECGALTRLFPEIESLFGTPKSIEWHPEVDTGLHTMLVLDQAENMSSDLSVRFAALTHDLGKGGTPKEFLPNHPGHEERSAEIVEDICNRLPVPKTCRDFATLVAKLHTNCHMALKLDFNSILDLLEKVDAFRRPQRFENFLIACEADSKGRTGFEKNPYPQSDFLRGALAAACSINTNNFAKEYKGIEIAKALKLARLSAIKEYMKINKLNN